MITKLFSFFIALIFVFSRAFAFEPASFEPNVVDEMGVLSLEEKNQINGLIETLNQRAQVKAAVYFVKSLDGESIEVAAERTFKKWELGERGKDNGILLIFDINDRNARIETGYGLEGNIPDISALQVLDSVILPKFKEQLYADGVKRGLYAIAYLNTKDASFLMTEENLESINISNFEKEDEPFTATGFRYWLVWVVFIIFAPLLSRILTVLHSGIPKENFGEQEHTLKAKLKYIFGLTLPKISLTIFFMINPGIFIAMAPSILPKIPWQLIDPKFYDRGRLYWLSTLVFLIFIPSISRGIAFQIGKIRVNRNPVLRLKGTEKFRFILGLANAHMISAIIGAFIGRAILAAFLTAGCLMLSYFFAEASKTIIAICLILMTFSFWKNSIRPILSEKAYLRKLALEKLHRIKTRVEGTRQIFGKTHTYYKPRTSSSSGSSSRSSSSGGGRSGGGGASSRW
jgi:uncharacterized membrane protein YgcG